MQSSGMWAMAVAAILFTVFTTNVAIGALGGPGAVFLSDIVEMLTLFAATISFVIAFLARERAVSGQGNPDGQELEDN